MYPTISFFLKDAFGLDIPLPFPMFGFLVAIAFFAAAWFFARELKRKEAEGLVFPQPKTRTLGKPFAVSEYFSTGLMGFIIGYKMGYAILNYTAFSADPQAILLSTKGNLVGGIILAGIMLFFRFRDDKKQRLPEPITEDYLQHPYQHVGNMTMIAAIAGILGAKLFHNLEEWDYFVADPVDALLSFSGLSVYGGLLIGGASVIYYAVRNGIHPLHLIDACAPGLMLAYAIGRIGCHVSGDGDWGIVNTADAPGFIPSRLWAYTYPNNVLSEGIPIPGCSGPYCHVLPQPVYPTPLYESIACLILFAGLWAIRKRIRIPGVLFCVYLIINGIERFLIEKIRVNPPYNIAGLEATQAEIISVLLLLLGIGGIFVLYKKNAHEEKQPD